MVGLWCDYHICKSRQVLLSHRRLSEGKIKLNLDPIFFLIFLLSSHVNNVLGIKCGLINESFAALWHRCSGPISKERMERLIREEILKPLNFLDFGTCVDFIKGKFTKTKKKDVAGSSELLEITHTDICGKMCCSSIDGDKYFITFIHHYSRYGHIYLFIEKSEDVDFFKIYKSEVKKRLGKSIQVVRSDCEGE